MGVLSQFGGVALGRGGVHGTKRSERDWWRPYRAWGNLIDRVPGAPPQAIILQAFSPKGNGTAVTDRRYSRVVEL